MSPPPPHHKQEPGVRFMAATGRLLSHEPNVPSHKSQAARWFYEEALFLERGVAGPSWQSSDLRSQVPAFLCPTPRVTVTRAGSINQAVYHRSACF